MGADHPRRSLCRGQLPVPLARLSALSQPARLHGTAGRGAGRRHPPGRRQHRGSRGRVDRGAPMRPAIAALATTLGPTLIGARWVGGRPLLRYSLGALVGLVIVAFGALLGGLVGAVVPSVLLACLAGWLLGPRLRFQPSEELQAGRLAHGVTW